MAAFVDTFTLEWRRRLYERIGSRAEAAVHWISDFEEVGVLSLARFKCPLIYIIDRRRWKTAGSPAKIYFYR